LEPIVVEVGGDAGADRLGAEPAPQPQAMQGLDDTGDGERRQHEEPAVCQKGAAISNASVAASARLPAALVARTRRRYDRSEPGEMDRPLVAGRAQSASMPSRRYW
jgi:hypothetical protein